MQIKDNVFLITGGGSGLGAATAQRLAADGGKVVIADLNAEAGRATAAAIGANARFVEANVADEAAVAEAVATAVREFGALHGAINCAGIATGERVVGKNGPHSLAGFERVIRINLIGTFNVIRLAAAQMATQSPLPSGERGVLVNTASVAAFDGQIGQAAYAASKAGVVGMALPIARELARYGIRVNTIAPGLFLTPMMEALPQDVQDSLGKATPFPPRLGRPADAAAAYERVLAGGGGRYFASIDRGIDGFKARANLAAVYADLGRWSDAESLLRAVVAEVPAYRPGWRGLGALLVRRGRVGEAEELVGRLAADPQLAAEGHLLAARVASDRGRLTEARQAWAADQVATWPLSRLLN